MFEQTFKNIDDVLWKEAGCTTELDYTEQTSWMLFLKYLDDLEHERAMEAELVGKSYDFIIDEAHRWSSWAAPKDAKGEFDHDNALTGDDLITYVDRELFPYLQGFKLTAASPDTIEYKIGEIFGEIKNRFQSGYSLRDALELMDGLRFRSQKEKHELSHIYEAKIKNMGNAGRNGGEYYTPRPLIRAMIQVTKPQLGERIYDGAVGSAGFLCEAYDYLREHNADNLTTSQLQILQTKTFYGKEKKSLAYVIAIMNMILHGIDAPNIIHTNTLSENISDIQEKDRYDVILANPPFGGKERKEVQQNFPIKTAETAHLFLQHFIKNLKVGGRGTVVIKKTFLSNTDNASCSLRKQILEDCNLHSILDCPKGTFLGTGEQTVVLFFEKGKSTKKIWYYQLNPGRSLGKTSPLNDADLAEFVDFQSTFKESANSWYVKVTDIDKINYNLAPKNPSTKTKFSHRDASNVISEIRKIQERASLANSDLLTHQSKLARVDSTILWETKTIGDVMSLEYGKPLDKEDRSEAGKFPAYGANGIKCMTDKSLYNKPSIVVGRKGSAGEVTLVDANFWPLDVTYYAVFDESEYDRQYLYYCLKQLNLPSLAKGIKPGINRNDVYALKYPFPPIREQERIVESIEKSFRNISRVADILKEEVRLLEELKSSILEEIIHNSERNDDKIKRISVA